MIPYLFHPFSSTYEFNYTIEKTISINLQNLLLLLKNILFHFTGKFGKYLVL